ncbi:DUF1840 domain-containing protein [Duganella violaceipulchra]|uniref:DUF1840 domain-containing protein n=1 Tax=Duganella violaceipulchra TaxID=2849652 RepID=A0AA41HBC0_9BURK|nr:DUF1840 domain-containing protein [Duganella violaceicalia]MBV6324240.1 DUF1840 domain-containing protein [Duganella violaceicalia]MCP2011827.1 putative membrane protein YkoI [Duganella violaceicalia]
MLISFKSKSSPEVLMYQEHAQRILDLLHKNPTRGVITAEEAAHALSLLEGEVAASKLHPETDVEHDVHTHEQEDGESMEHAVMQRVGFAARAFPLLEMLRSAKQENESIIWGV